MSDNTRTGVVTDERRESGRIFTYLVREDSVEVRNSFRANKAARLLTSTTCYRGKHAESNICALRTVHWRSARTVSMDLCVRRRSQLASNDDSQIALIRPAGSELLPASRLLRAKAMAVFVGNEEGLDHLG